MWRQFVRCKPGPIIAQQQTCSKAVQGSSLLGKWREHLLIKGDRYVACVRCWRYGAGSSQLWTRLPCKWNINQVPKATRAVFLSGDFSGSWVHPVRRRAEVHERLARAGLWHSCDPEGEPH